MQLTRILVLGSASLASARAVVGSTNQLTKSIVPLTLNDTCSPNVLGCHNYDREWATKPKNPEASPESWKDLGKYPELEEIVGKWTRPILPVEKRDINPTLSTTVLTEPLTVANAPPFPFHPLTEFGKSNETSTSTTTSLDKRDMFGSGSGGQQLPYCPGWPTAVRHNLTHVSLPTPFFLYSTRLFYMLANIRTSIKFGISDVSVRVIIVLRDRIVLMGGWTIKVLIFKGGWCVGIRFCLLEYRRWVRDL